MKRGQLVAFSYGSGDVRKNIVGEYVEGYKKRNSDYTLNIARFKLIYHEESHVNHVPYLANKDTLVLANRKKHDFSEGKGQRGMISLQIID